MFTFHKHTKVNGVIWKKKKIFSWDNKVNKIMNYEKGVPYKAELGKAENVFHQNT